MRSPISAVDFELDSNTTAALVRRLELKATLLKRLEEEEITRCVALPDSWVEQSIDAVLDGVPRQEFLDRRCWSEEDLWLHVCRPEALRRFADQHFGSGLEEQFLASRGAHDQIIYSLIRVRDPALARELWIRIEEKETTFAEAAQHFGEGPESARNGLIGPMSMGQLLPAPLAKLVRSLQPGRVSAPKSMGEWHVLIRLEQLTPAKFDATMRAHMLQSTLDEFLGERVRKRLEGQSRDPLTYHADS